MKKKLLTMLGKKFTLTAIAACSLTVVIISSCTKKSDTNYAPQFEGTWNVTANTCGGGNSSFVIAAGSGNNALATTGSVGASTACIKAVTETGTASSNSCVFPPQTFTDGCGLSYTISLSGTLSGNTLTATETVSGAVNATCTVTATK